MLQRSDSSVLRDLVPWEYEVSAGYIARGFYTKPTGKPVLHFVHGNGFCGLTYEWLLSYLQDDVDLFISDTQGHGDSEEGGKYRSWNAGSFQLEEVWQHFSPMYGDVPRIACGHSYGAVTSTLIMSRRPDLFDFALFLDPTYAPPTTANTFSALASLGLSKNFSLAKQALVRTVTWADEKTLWDYFYQRGVFKGWQDQCLQSYLDHAMTKEADGSFHLKCPPRIEAAIFASYASGLWHAISTIHKPVTMFYGERTMPFILKSRHKIHKRNPCYDFNGLPGGHCFMQQKPQQTANEMRRKIRLRLKQCS